MSKHNESVSWKQIVIGSMAFSAIVGGALALSSYQSITGTYLTLPKLLTELGLWSALGLFLSPLAVGLNALLSE